MVRKSLVVVRVELQRLRRQAQRAVGSDVLGAGGRYSRSSATRPNTAGPSAQESSSKPASWTTSAAISSARASPPPPAGWRTRCGTRPARAMTTSGHGPVVASGSGVTRVGKRDRLEDPGEVLVAGSPRHDDSTEARQAVSTSSSRSNCDTAVRARATSTSSAANDARSRSDRNLATATHAERGRESDRGRPGDPGAVVRPGLPVPVGTSLQKPLNARDGELGIPQDRQEPAALNREAAPNWREPATSSRPGTGYRCHPRRSAATDPEVGGGTPRSGSPAEDPQLTIGYRTRSQSRWRPNGVVRAAPSPVNA